MADDKFVQLDNAIESEMQERENVEHIQRLSSYIWQCWESARENKREVQRELYEASLQRNGKYTEEKRALHKKQSGVDIYMNLTSVKCRAAESWLRDILSDTDNIWDIKSTPIPELTPELSQYLIERITDEIISSPVALAIDDPKELNDYVHEEVKKELNEEGRKIAKRMKRKMADQLIDANWRKAIEDVIPDIVTFKAGFIKGPIVRKKNKLVWSYNDTTGEWQAVQQPSIVLEYERVSPFDIYPSAYSTSIDDGYTIERHEYTKRDISDMIGVAGYDDLAIIAVLKKYGETGYTVLNDAEDQRYKDKASNISADDKRSSPDKKIEALEFWGSALGEMLIEWGMSREDIDPSKEYQINAIMIGDYVIKARLNPNPTGKKPYYKASYEEIPGSFWGRGIPELMKDIQDIANACARALVTNMGISSGPQGMVDVSQLTPDIDVKTLYPWKIWTYDSNEMVPGATMARKPIEFFMPESNIRDLMYVFNEFESKAEEVTGIPSYVYGSTDIGSAGRTATGLSMLMSNASKGIKFVLSNIDDNIIKPSLEELYIFNMMFLNDPQLKGDLKIIAKGVVSLTEKNQTQLRQIEFMNIIGKNPLYIDIIGRRGIAKLLRRLVVSLSIDADDIVPTDEEMEAQEKMVSMIQQQQQQLSSQALPIVNRADQSNPANLTPDGRRVGGVDESLFVANRR